MTVFTTGGEKVNQEEGVRGTRECITPCRETKPYFYPSQCDETIRERTWKPGEKVESTSCFKI